MDFWARITDRDAVEALLRLQAETPTALRRGLLKFALLVGREVAQRAPQRTRRLARSFLVPIVVSPTTVLLGRGVPIYGAIHEYGGTIVPKRAPALVFQVDGHWVRTQKVKIREKRYARGGIEATDQYGPMIIGREIANAFHA